MDDGTRISEDVEQFLRAARAGDVARCSALLEQTPSLLNSVEAGGYGALHFAAANRDLALLRMLLRRRPTVDLENYDGNTALVLAVKAGSIEATDALIAAGADVNHTSRTGATPAHHAVAAGHVDVLRHLVTTHHATVASSSSCEAGSLLHWACHSGDVHCVGAVLYEFGVPVNTTDAHGGTALFTALFMQQLDVVNFLLEHGADVHVVIAGDGTTPLHIAAEHATAECVRALCAFGANVQATNAAGECARDVASRRSDAAPRDAVLRELTRVRVVDADKRTEAAMRAKEQGNKAFAQGEHVKAAKFYTMAIQYDRNNHVYFSNRAACYFHQRRCREAYWDACRCIALQPQWAKGYARKAATELAMKRYADAERTAAHGLRLEPANKDLALIMNDAHKQQQQQQRGK